MAVRVAGVGKQVNRRTDFGPLRVPNFTEMQNPAKIEVFSRFLRRTNCSSPAVRRQVFSSPWLKS